MKKVATFFCVFLCTLLKTQKSIKVSTFSFHFQQLLCQTKGGGGNFSGSGSLKRGCFYGY